MVFILPLVFNLYAHHVLISQHLRLNLHCHIFSFNMHVLPCLCIPSLLSFNMHLFRTVFFSVGFHFLALSCTHAPLSPLPLDSFPFSPLFHFFFQFFYNKNSVSYHLLEEYDCIGRRNSFFSLKGRKRHIVQHMGYGL